MKRKGYVTICAILAVAALIFLLYQSRNSSGGKEEVCRSVDKSQETETAKPEENLREKIELMDYAELTVEEFMEGTGLVLYPRDRSESPMLAEDETAWVTEDDVVHVIVNDGKIIGLSIDGVLCDDEAEEKIKKEGFPYTLAGIALNDDIYGIEETILKDACHDEGMLNIEYYSSLYLSKLGIGTLEIDHDAGPIQAVSADFDQSLKENSEELEYIWTERIRQKEGERNDKLELSQDPYTRLPDRYSDAENIEKTVVWIKYPSLEIPGKPEMTENANEVIQEAVKKIEDNTYGKTDKKLIIEADYLISYITGNFISICFSAQIRDGSGKKYLWQYCNINMNENGKKAYLSDVGISKENVGELCKRGHEKGPVDIEKCLESYDTNWDQYNITPKEYNIIVKPLYEEEWNREFGEPSCVLSIRK